MHFDGSFLDIEEAKEQPEDGGLARACRANYCDVLSLADCKGYAIKRLPGLGHVGIGFFVRECHFFERNVASAPNELDSIRTIDNFV